MDKMQPENIKETCDTADTNLPAVMAGLEMLTVNANLASSNESLNRRCSLRPRKRPSSEMEDNKRRNKSEEVQLKEYYLNRNLKRKLNSLETIYEEKDDTNECITFMSAKRYKRMIQFEEKPTESKLKKRRAKIKRLYGSKINFKQRRASMQVLLEKLNGIRAESPAKIDNEAK